MGKGDKGELPPLGATVRASEGVWKIEEIGPEWRIVARRKAGQGSWHFLLDPEEERVFRLMVNDGALTTVQRRDPHETVLLTKRTAAQ